MSRFSFQGNPLIKRHLSRASCLAYSPAGSLIASTGSGDMTVRVWRSDSGELIRTFIVGEIGWMNSVDDVQFSRDGKTLFTVALDLRAYDLDSGQMKWTRKSNRIPLYWLSPNGRHAAILENWFLSKSRCERIMRSLSEEEAAVFDPKAWQTRLRVLDLDANKFLSIPYPPLEPKCFSHDGAFLRVEGLTGNEDEDAEELYLAVATGDRVRGEAATRILAPDREAGMGIPIPGTSLLIKTDFNRLCRIVDSSDPSFLREIDPGPSYDVCARGSPTGHQFAIGDDSGAIRLVSTSTWQVERVIPGACEVSDIAVSPGSRFLAAVCRPNYNGPLFVVIWDLETLKLLGAMKPESDTTWTHSVDLQGTYSYDHRLRRFEIIGSEEHRLHQKARSFDIDGNGQIVLRPQQVPHCRIVFPDRQLGSTESQQLDYSRVRPDRDRWLSHNGRWLVIARPDRTVVVDVDREAIAHELPSGLPPPKTLFLGGEPVATSVSEDGSRAAVGHSMIQDIDVILYDFKKRRVTLNQRICCDTYDSLAFHPANLYLAVGDAYQSMVQIVDLRKRRKTKRLEAHVGSITSLEFCPDGSRLISAGADGQIILWDAETFERQATLMAFPNPGELDKTPQWFTFKPDGDINGSPSVQELFTGLPTL